MGSRQSLGSHQRITIAEERRIRGMILNSLLLATYPNPLKPMFRCDVSMVFVDLTEHFYVYVLTYYLLVYIVVLIIRFHARFGELRK